MTGRPVGLTKDAGWEIGVSRTLPATVEEVWDLLVSPAGLAAWLGDGVTLPLERGATYRTRAGTVGEVRSARPEDRIRLTWQPAGRRAPAILQVAVVAAPGGCSVRFHAERLDDAGERERMRARLRAAIDRLADLLPA